MAYPFHQAVSPCLFVSTSFFMEPLEHTGGHFLLGECAASIFSAFRTFIVSVVLSCSTYPHYIASIFFFFLSYSALECPPMMLSFIMAPCTILISFLYWEVIPFPVEIMIFIGEQTMRICLKILKLHRVTWTSELHGVLWQDLKVQFCSLPSHVARSSGPFLFL